MHCANLDTLVKGTNPLHQSSQQTTQLAKNMETKEEEDERMLRMVLDAGVLVLEGRLPDQTSKRGYVEGPHCVLYPHTQTHRCDFSNYMCKRVEKYRQLMQSIWKEYKGLCIELRVCAECNCGEKQVWKKTASRFDYVLEQWYFQITNVRNDDDDIGVMNWYGLLQAIRSQIHFSQLSAWWSSNRATLPKNITYRVLPVLQADLNSCPLRHKFPVLAFSTTYLQVKVRSQPRSEVLPKIHCPLHCNQKDVVDDRMKICCDRFGKHHCQALDDVDENDNERWYNDCNEKLPDDDHVVYERPSIEWPYRDRNPSRKAFRKMSTSNIADEDLLRSPSGGKNMLFSTFRGPSCSFRPSANTSPKNSVDRSSQRSLYEDQDKFNLNAVSNSLSEETSAQFLNIYNWTNTMVSNMVLKMRTSNSFLNSFSDSNPLSELLYHKIDLNSDENCEYHDERTNGVSRRAKSLKERRCEKDKGVTSIDLDSVDFESQNKYKIVNAVSVSSSGDTNSRISDSVDTKLVKISLMDDYHTSVESKGDEVSTKGSSKLASAVVWEKSSEKLKHSSEKCSRFKKSQKRLLPFAGNFVESVLSGRVYFNRVIENFKMKITFGGSFTAQNSCTDLPAATYYYHFGDGELCKSYLVRSCIPENEKGIQIPSVGRLQVGIFNTEESLIKVFVISYDLTDMTRCSKTYIRHSNYYTPKCSPEYNVKWLQSFLRLKCCCSKSGRLYLQNEVNVIIFQKSDINTACEFKMKTDLKHHDVTEIEYKKEGFFKCK